MKGLNTPVQIRIHKKHDECDVEKFRPIVEAAVQNTLSFFPSIADMAEEMESNLAVDISFITAEAIKSINNEFRDIDETTDILSFPTYSWKEGELQENLAPWMIEPQAEGKAEFHLGELLFNLDTVAQQAKEQEHSIEEELYFLTVHGILHLIGYDHVHDDDAEHMENLQKIIVQTGKVTKKKHCGYVALVGRPNVGKSTLLNYLAGMTLAITTPKPQTTREMIRSVYNDSDCQIAFLDTPGFHKAKTSLDRAMVKATRTAIRQADLVLLMIEASYKPFVANLEKQLLKLAAEDDTAVILLLNKADIAIKENMLPLMAAYSEAYPFKALIPISARTGDGVDIVIEEVKKNLALQEPIFRENDETNQTERKLASELIRREVLMQTQEEVPFGVAVKIEDFIEEEINGIRNVEISAVIFCNKESHKAILIGRKGQMIKSIGTKARAAISEMLQARVRLDLFVKVRPNWMNRPQDIKDIGIETKEIELP